MESKPLTNKEIYGFKDHNEMDSCIKKRGWKIFMDIILQHRKSSKAKERSIAQINDRQNNST